MQTIYLTRILAVFFTIPLSISIIPLSVSPAQATAAGQPQRIMEYMGVGCSTAFELDQDCDGMGIGRTEAISGTPQAPGYSALTPSLLFSDLPDANPHDPTINTTASVVQRFGDLANINNMKAYLASLGYTNVGDIYYVSVNGNDATAQKNNINLPYRQSHPVAINGAQIVQPGDVVIFRGGKYPTLYLKGREGGVPWTLYGLQGAQNAPILMINFPGEKVTFAGQYGALGFNVDAKHLILDGLKFSGHWGQGQDITLDNYSIHVVRLDDHYIENITFKNYEISNAFRWGFFSTIRTAVGNQINGLTFTEGSVHDILEEHGFYFNDFGQTPSHQTNLNIKIEKSLIYYCGRNGIQMRGSDGSVISGNVIHSNNLTGIQTHNDVRNLTISNNLIFNNSAAPISLFEDSNVLRNGGGINNIRVVNNTLAAKAGSNGLFPDSNNTAFPAIQIAHETPNTVFNNVVIANNMLHTASNKEPIYLSSGIDLPQLSVRNNRFFGNSSGTNSLGVCGYSDGTQTDIATTSMCNAGVAYWNFAAMQNPAVRPNFTQNSYGFPGFSNVDVIGNLLQPWRNNFYPAAGSPLLNASAEQYATQRDLQGLMNYGMRDIGAIEFQDPSTMPVFAAMTPSVFPNHQPTNVVLSGLNLFADGQVTRVKYSEQYDPGIWGYAGEDICQIVNANTINCVAPAGLKPGTYNLQLMRNQWKSQIVPWTVTGSPPAQVAQQPLR